MSIKGIGRRYYQEYKNIIVDLFKSGMGLAELSSEYGIAKSTINGWIKDVKEIKVDENEVMTLKEVKALKKDLVRNIDKLLEIGFEMDDNSKLPDVILYLENKNWIYFIEAVTSVGPMSDKRIIEINEMMKNCIPSDICYKLFKGRFI